MECCTTKRNFGHPLCVEDFGVITSFILVPFRDSDGAPNRYDLTELDYTMIMANLYAQPNTRWYPIPQLNNVTPPTAGDSIKEEAGSGKTAFIRTGVIGFTAETWGSDATSVFKGKLESLRCGQWGFLLVTSENKIVGSRKRIGGVEYLYPIAIDAQSVDPKFMFKTDTTTNKVMIMLNLDRNFDDSTYYAIGGDEIWDTTDEVVKSIDFNDLPQIIDCTLVASGGSTTSLTVTVNDDYRMGQRITGVDDAGNVTGLLLADFLVENLTDATTITPSGVVESSTGVYVFTFSAQTSGDNLKVSLNIDDTDVVNYSGSVESLVP